MLDVCRNELRSGSGRFGRELSEMRNEPRRVERFDVFLDEGGESLDPWGFSLSYPSLSAGMSSGETEEED